MKETPKSLGGMNLPEELLLQILHKLPIRYALQCKLVCKEWLCLVSDPFFKSTYDSLNQSPTLILFPPPNSPLPAFSYEIDASHLTTPLVGQPWPLPCGFDDFPVTVIGSYNGLVALYKDVDDFPFFCLFNPCTKEEKRVRIPPCDEYFRHFWGVNVDSVTGVCHDPNSDEYKVVVTRFNSSPRFLLVRFKDDGTDDCWKIGTKTTHEAIDDLCTPLVCGLGTTIEGAPHWISYRKGTIMYFDWRSEEFRVAKLPKGVEIEDWCWDDDGDWRLEMKPANACGLGALDGKLTVAFVSKGGRCEVWGLRDYEDDDSWRLLFVMKVDRLCPFSLLSWIKDEWVILIFYDDDEQELMIYDVMLRSFRRLEMSLRRRSSFPSSNNMMTYFASLVSPTN